MPGWPLGRRLVLFSLHIGVWFDNPNPVWYSLNLPVKAEEETTLRLEETAGGTAPNGVTGIRWHFPDARACYSRLDRDRLTLGRCETRDVRLEASGVSREHAEIYRQGPVYAVRDCGSTNGTYVNGRAALHAALSPGDVLRLGDVVGLVIRGSENAALELPDTYVLEEDIVFGPGLRDELEAMRRVGPSRLPVVIQGETGSGKECAARALHRFSGRSGPFHAVNCAALPAALAEAELFGHKKGAFTGAEQAGLGHFRAAEEGTLFLDEVAELPMPIQAKLLRVIQERELTPLGETRSQEIDVRILAAVQEPLSVLVESKRLREDLAMRLRGLVLVLPPLRTRRADIAVLFDCFLKRYSGGRPPLVEPKMLEEVLSHDFPGNVRELELLVQQLLVLHGHEPVLRRAMLPEAMRRSFPPDPAPPTGEATQDRREHDLRRLVGKLRENGGNIARAAASLGLSRQRAYRLLNGRSRSDLMEENAPESGDQKA